MEVETTEEQAQYVAAYEAWVTQARKEGRSADPEMFRAGWLAGLAAAKSHSAE